MIHIVKQGETLSGIAKQYDISLRRLLQANPKIRNPDRINVNQKVKVPIQPKGTTPPGKVRASKKVLINGHQVEDATPSQATQVLEAHNLAITMCQAAVEKLYGAKETPFEPLQRLFDVQGTGPTDQSFIRTLVTRFNVMGGAFGSVTYDVDWYPIPRVASVPANNFQKVLYGDCITIYRPYFFDYPTIAQAQTLVHEMSHYVYGTEDYAYAEASYTLTKDKKFRNADNYGLFAFECHAGFKMY